MKKLTMSFFDYDLKVVISGLKIHTFKDYCLTIDKLIKLGWISKREILGLYERENGDLDLVIKFKDKTAHFYFLEFNKEEIKKHFKTQNLSYWSEKVKPLI